ncbi:MAG: aminotransferase class I/II-fold pyridoxal phosphate-dependent enzyme, partial [Lachnospiraceae bacterium]|nr:aminotransferase class I/II-fold pyridoxal phosphate-dependent enzyme [Lachnospiraceae bacterium]
MSIHIASRMNQLAPSGIRKINEKALAMERAGASVIHFEIGRPDFDTPAYIKQAAYRALEEGQIHYTSNFGTMELRQAIADKLNRENNIPYQASEVLVTVGLSEAVFAVLSTILDEGDEILIPNPVWLNYLNVPRLLGAIPVSYELREENGYEMDLDEIRAKITERTRAIVLVTPNNPTGGVLSEETLQGLAQ